MGNLIDLWMVGYVGKKNHSKKYRENIKCQTGIIREWIGEVAHTALTREMIRDWHTANGHRRSQANEIVDRLKRIWEWCEGEDDILSAGAPTRAKLFAKLREMRYH